MAEAELVTHAENAAIITAVERLTKEATERRIPTLVTITAAHDVPGLPSTVTAQVGPDGFKSIRGLLDEYRAHPQRRKGTATFGTLDSLIAFVARFGDHTSVVFANDKRGERGFTAVLDYNAPVNLPELSAQLDGGEEEGVASAAVILDAVVAAAGEAGQLPTAVPGWLQHRGTIKLKPSDQFEKWSAINDKWLDGETLAEFLEERILDILPPPTVGDDPLRQQMEAIGGRAGSANDIMSLARTFKVIATRENVEVRNLTTGETEISYKEEHKDEGGQKINPPTCFVTGIPIYHGEAAYRLLARLRYRATRNGMAWKVILTRLDIAEDDAFAQAVARVRRETALPVYIGLPESI